MSTPTLTREQVITLQFIHRSAPAPCLDLSWDFLEDLEDEDHPLYLLVGVDDNSARLTAAGREALAAYDQERAMVSILDVLLLVNAADRGIARDDRLPFDLRVYTDADRDALAHLRAALAPDSDRALVRWNEDTAILIRRIEAARAAVEEKDK